MWCAQEKRVTYNRKHQCATIQNLDYSYNSHYHCSSFLHPEGHIHQYNGIRNFHRCLGSYVRSRVYRFRIHQRLKQCKAENNEHTFPFENEVVNFIHCTRITVNAFGLGPTQFWKWLLHTEFKVSCFHAADSRQYLAKMLNICSNFNSKITLKLIILQSGNRPIHPRFQS